MGNTNSQEINKLRSDHDRMEARLEKVQNENVEVDDRIRKQQAQFDYENAVLENRIQKQQAQFDKNERSRKAVEAATPWRNVFLWKDEEFTRFVKTINQYQPMSGIVARAKIMLVGQIGAGKSSFINTVFSAVQQRQVQMAAVATEGFSVTKHFRAYRMEDKEGFTIYDTMGLETDSMGFKVADFKNAIAGHLMNDYQFGKRQNSRWRSEPTLEHRMHVVVFVIDCANVHVMDDNLVMQIKTMRLEANRKGIPVAMILTHCDQAFPELRHNIKHIYKDRDVDKAVKAAAQITGIPNCNIFPVINDVVGIQLGEIRLLAAYVFTKLLCFADDYLRNQMCDDDD